MRNFTMVSPRICRSSKFKSLSQNGQLLYLYLLTSEHQNMAGAYRLPPAYGADDLSWLVDEFETVLSQVVASGLVHRDPETDEVVIAQWFKFNPAKGKPTIKGVENILDKIESESLYELATSALEESINEQADNNVRNGQEQAAKPLPQKNGMSLDQVLTNNSSSRTANQHTASRGY